MISITACQFRKFVLPKRSFAPKLWKKNLSDLSDVWISELWNVIVDLSFNCHFIHEETWDPERCNDSPTCTSWEAWQLGRVWGPEEGEFWALLVLVLVELIFSILCIRDCGHRASPWHRLCPIFEDSGLLKDEEISRLDYENYTHKRRNIHPEQSPFVDNILKI